MGQETRAEAPRYQSFNALNGSIRREGEVALIDACLGGGGHYWNDADLGDNFRCTRCPMIGARNWPTINECG